MGEREREVRASFRKTYTLNLVHVKTQRKRLGGERKTTVGLAGLKMTLNSLS